MPQSSELHWQPWQPPLRGAQVELIDPEKSMVATIRPEGQRCGRADLPLCPLVGWAQHYP